MAYTDYNYDNPLEVGPDDPWTPPGTEPEDPNGPQAPQTPNTTCPSGQSWNNVHNKCMPDCPAGTSRAGNANGECTPIDYNPNPNESGGGSSSSSGGTGAYKPPGYTPTKSPYDAALSKQLFDMLTNMLNGGDAPFGPETIAKLQAAALQSNKSQLAGSERALQRRLISSGLSRSGAAASSTAQLRSNADADLSNNFRTVAVTAVQKNYEAKQTALAQAQQFLQSERANALSQDQMILAYARLKQESENLEKQFAQQWKLAQSGNQWELEKLMICLRTGVC